MIPVEIQAHRDCRPVLSEKVVQYTLEGPLVLGDQAKERGMEIVSSIRRGNTDVYLHTVRQRERGGLALSAGQIAKVDITPEQAEMLRAQMGADFSVSGLPAQAAAKK